MTRVSLITTPCSSTDYKIEHLVAYHLLLGEMNLAHASTLSAVVSCTEKAYIRSSGPERRRNWIGRSTTLTLPTTHEKNAVRSYPGSQEDAVHDSLDAQDIFFSTLSSFRDTFSRCFSIGKVLPMGSAAGGTSDAQLRWWLWLTPELGDTHPIGFGSAKTVTKSFTTISPV